MPVLATPAMRDLILQAWRAADHWQVGRYVILPDHVHLFCAPRLYPAKPLLNWMRYWKAMVAKATGTGPDSLWEKNFWDTQLRQGDSYAAKWEYVKSNPVRHSLVTRPEDWPYQGEVHSLRWHD
jgi:REP element-mobilizing transposase RayT